MPRNNEKTTIEPVNSDKPVIKLSENISSQNYFVNLITININITFIKIEYTLIGSGIFYLVDKLLS